VSSEDGSLARAAQRIDWASKALDAAANDLQAAGRLAAALAVEEEADRLEGLAAEVRELAKVEA